MRLRFLLPLLLGIAGACGSFEADPAAPKVPANEAGTTNPNEPDGGGAASSSGGDAAGAGCKPVQHLDFTGSPDDSDDAEITFSAGAIHVTCDGDRDETVKAYYEHALDDVAIPLRVRIHHLITGPAADGRTGLKEPLTFGCGLFFTTSEGQEVQVRFEIAGTKYELDGENDNKIDGGDPPGTKFENAKPSPIGERPFDLEATIKDGVVESKGTIDGEPRDAAPVFFTGRVNSVILRCGLLSYDKGEPEDCDLTIRDMDVEVCQP